MTSGRSPPWLLLPPLPLLCVLLLLLLPASTCFVCCVKPLSSCLRPHLVASQCLGPLACRVVSNGHCSCPGHARDVCLLIKALVMPGQQRHQQQPSQQHRLPNDTTFVAQLQHALQFLDRVGRAAVAAVEGINGGRGGCGGWGPRRAAAGVTAAGVAVQVWLLWGGPSWWLCLGPHPGLMIAGCEGNEVKLGLQCVECFPAGFGGGGGVAGV